MIKNQRVLLSSKVITGRGALYLQDTYLGDCDYRLELRRSKILGARSKSKKSSFPPFQILTTMAGTFKVGGELSVKIYSKRNQLTLHLNDDYLMPVCAFPTTAGHNVFSIIGRVVTEPMEDAEYSHYI